jgi:Domain of unknown function (DUF4333)
MSFVDRVGAIAALMLAAAVAIGCGTALDDEKNEDQVKASVEEVRGTAVSSVDCPSGVEVEPGTIVICEVSFPGGKTERAKLKIRDEDANLDFLDLSPAK